MQLMRAGIDRRDLLKTMGGLVIGFSLAGASRSDAAPAVAAGDYGPPENQIDSCIAISEEGHATLFSGC